LNKALLVTKLYRPVVRPRRVARPRLLARLDETLTRRLGLIAAPAGYGKTTVVSEWLAKLGNSNGGLAGGESIPNSQLPITSYQPPNWAWLSLDAGDNDPGRFLAYLGAALQQIDERIGAGAEAEAAAPMPAVEAALTRLINDVAATGQQAVLVLDDYHAIENDFIHETVRFLVDRQPPCLHLVITTRHEPPLPLARLRARDELMELRAADLRFTPEETRQFFRDTMGLDLPPAVADTLEARSEGWPAGLQLAALSLRGQAEPDTAAGGFGGAHEFVLDYLTDEVLRQQPAAVQSFLLHSSVLDRLHAPLCDAALWRDDSQAMLQTLQANNLFIIPLDEAGRYFRYHHLFREALHSRLLRAGAGLLPVLHRRASRWFHEQGQLPEAIEHALLGEDFSWAAGLIEQAAEGAVMRGELGLLERWLAAVPQAAGPPRLWLYRALVAMMHGRPQAGEQALLEAARAAGEAGAEPLQGEVAAVRALLAIMQDSERDRVADLGRQALAQLPPAGGLLRDVAAWTVAMGHYLQGEEATAQRLFDEAIARGLESGNAFVALLALYVLGASHLARGYLNRAEEIYRQMAGLVEALPQGTLFSGQPSILYGDLLRERGDFGRAERYLKEGMALSRGLGNAAFIVDGDIALARLRQAQGDPAAFDLIQQAEQLARQEGMVPATLTQIECYRVQFLAAARRLDETDGWLAERSRAGSLPSALRPETVFVRELETLTLARLMLARGRAAESIALTQAALAFPEASADLATRVEGTLLRALALQAGGDGAALAALEAALALAEPEGFCRAIADHGAPVADLLRSYLRAGEPVPALEAYARTLLAAIESPGVAVEPRRAAPALAEPLNEREQEILGLVAAGQTNQEIALGLNLSLSTVKWHLYNVYGKLSVRNRTEAVARAREAGLIPA
jgi:LuxR family maltose regulon positive regulatory protein